MPVVGRLRKHNVLRTGPVGPKTPATRHSDIFQMIMSPDIINIIVGETNRRAAVRFPAWELTTPTEMYAFLGLVLYAGVFNSSKVPVTELWAPEFFPIFKGTMSKTRFEHLCRFIRFDNGETRTQRLKSSKSAAIDDVWKIMMANLESSYNPHHNVTVDEQLFGYRGRTRFTQYIPSKPTKYGIKVWWICDAVSHYPLKGIVYTGKKEGSERATNQGEKIVMELAQKYAHTGRTVYADNFFSTLELAKKLIDNGLAYVGTVRSNKRFVPDEMRWSKNRVLNTTMFCHYKNDVSLCSYAARKNRVVIMISTEHYGDEIDANSPTTKPQQILDYNKSKGGVDVMDQMTSGYSCKRNTKRWPLALFYNMTDVAALAAFIIHQECNSTRGPSRRRLFIAELCRQLAVPQMLVRSQNSKIARFSHLREAWQKFGVVVSEQIEFVFYILLGRCKHIIYLCR